MKCLLANRIVLSVLVCFQLGGMACSKVEPIVPSGSKQAGSEQTESKITVQNAEIRPNGLLVEGNIKPLNVHNQQARLSWLANVISQHAYQIQVASTLALLNNEKADLWDSGKVTDKASRNIAYQGPVLNSQDSAYWRVRVWSDNKQNPSEWSEVGYWQMGLLQSSDWQAKWLQAPERKIVTSELAVSQWIDLVGTVEKEDGSIATSAIQQLHKMPSASLFRHEFSYNKQIVGAKLHSTAGGYYEVFINGQQVKDRLMDPGQTDFDKRILYNTDDVSTFLQQGKNVIGVHLGSGWYDEDIAFSGWKNPDAQSANKARKTYTFGQPTFIAQLELTFDDGSTQIVATNKNWLSHSSPVVKEGIFSGELYDASKVIENWNMIGAVEHAKNWKPVKVLKTWPTLSLEPQLLPAIRPVKLMQPVKVFQPKEGVWVFDFGQNFTGIPTLYLDKLNLKPRQGVYLRFAEWADDKGAISQLSGGGWATNLNAVDGYIAGETKQKSWTPSFTWHGFRYVELTGLAEKPSLDVLSAQLIRSDVKRVGQFESSDPLINRIHDTAMWSYESNLMSVPLDCPIREKAGWTGDAHAALITGNYNFNMQTFWEKYLGDFETALKVAPTVVPGKRTGGGKVDWAVAEVFIAWEHYRHHGDKQVLLNQYTSLQKYMAFGKSQMSDFLIKSGYGDWCDPVPSPGTPRVGGRGTPQWTTTTVTSTALFTQAANYMYKIAQVLNKNGDAAEYQLLNQNLKQGFHQALYEAESRHYGSQTADAMALQFGITPIELRQGVADALNQDVVENWKGHSSVGALGQTYLYLSLSDYGYTDTAFNIFKAKGYPGYSYLFDELGGTTLWERKGAFDPSKGRGPLRSLNHPFHSGYDGWFYQGLGGIRPLDNSVGFQEFMLKPVFPSQLKTAEVVYDAGYGQVKSHWLRKGDNIHWDFEIPNNTQAWVILPNQDKQIYTAGSYSLVIPSGQDYSVGASVIGNNPKERVTALSEESFEGGGWNAGRLYATYHPGHNASLPKNFRFTQFQGPHSFVAESSITRLGNYSAKLHWKHGNPAKWNRDPNKLDNEDRKAMFHGTNASSNTATVWHGFSVYFPSEDTLLTDKQDPLFFQLHGAPDKTAEGKEPGRNPPLALTITNYGFDVGYGWDARKFAKDTGGQGRDKFTVPLNIDDYKDKWVDFVIEVRANPFEEKGYIKMWINGKQMVNRTNIQLGYNDDKGLYPSWGWYQTGKHNAGRNSDMILYLDEIRHVEAVDADYYDVAPGFFAK